MRDLDAETYLTAPGVRQYARERTGETLTAAQIRRASLRGDMRARSTWTGSVMYRLDTVRAWLDARAAVQRDAPAPGER